MKILYLDFLYPKGHIRQNYTYINLLSDIAEVYVLTPEGRYSNLPMDIKVIENKYLKTKDGKISSRFNALKIMALSAVTAHKVKPDYIFISSYETMIFAIGRNFFSRKQKVFLLHHFNIDELGSRVKLWFFKKYMRKVDHIVFEDFIKDYIIKQFKLEEKKIHILPHQLNQNSPSNYENKYSCVGLSFSNDENIISQIIDIEKRKELLKKNGRKVILKSQLTEFDNGFLKVIKGYIDDKQYNEYIDNSLCIYMPFPLTFQYRMSGTLVDAFSNNKILLGNNIPIIQHYASRYRNICKVVNSAEAFFRIIIETEMFVHDYHVRDFERFRVEHSEEKIKENLNRIFKITECKKQEYE